MLYMRYTAFKTKHQNDRQLHLALLTDSKMNRYPASYTYIYIIQDMALIQMYLEFSNGDGTFNLFLLLIN